MNANIDDPRLTAYALNELAPGERAALEAELKASPELRAELEEIQQFTKTLSSGFASEPSPELSTAQRQAIAATPAPTNIVQLPQRRIFRTVALAALAASIMGVVTWQMWFNSPKRNQAVLGPGAARPLPADQAKELTKLTELKPVIKTPIPPPVTVPTVRPANPAPVESDSHSMTVVAQNGAPATPVHKVVVSPASVPPSVQPQIVTYADPVDVPETLKELSPNDADAKARTPQAPLVSRQTTLLQQQNSATTPQLAREKSSFGSSRAGSSGTVTPQADLGGNDSNDSRARKLGWGGPTVGDIGGLQTRPLGWRGDTIIVVPENGRHPHPHAYTRNPVPQDTAAYPHLVENAFEEVLRQPLSTFSADVDGASYANVRRFLNANQLPPPDAVRIEELLNYFSYDYAPPRGEDPFSVNLEVAGCPWNDEHRLVRVGIKTRELAAAKRPAGNFVFLIDVSGSMEPAERLPLIKQALRHLVMKLNANDRVAIVVYASEAGVKLASTPCSEKEKILEAIDSLTAGGSTNGGDGIQQAYLVARNNFIEGGINRVLLCTDGDFNVGMTDQNQLTRMIEEKAKGGVFLTTLGVGTDNYKDALMQKLADKGNGNYYYLDSAEEAQRVLIEQMNGTLVTVAKDVKFQVEFNPAQVSAYRLIGYEKRVMPKQDFNNDAKDAGEIGAGHTVTALYEIVPVGGTFQGAVDDLKYQSNPEKPDRYAEAGSKELLTLKLRYKQPDGDRSHLLVFPLTDKGTRFAKASRDFKFAAAVASFGMLLHDSEYKGNANYAAVEELAREAKGADDSGYRSEFITLIHKARSLQR